MTGHAVYGRPVDGFRVWVDGATGQVRFSRANVPVGVSIPSSWRLVERAAIYLLGQRLCRV